jgi:hypothetical protein
MRIKNGFATWTYERFFLLTVTPTRDFLVVLYDEDENHLYSWTADAIGVAKVKTVTCMCPVDAAGVRDFDRMEEVEVNFHREVVTLSLCDNELHIDREFSNYAGMCRVGDDISLVTAHLTMDVIDRLNAKKPVPTDDVPPEFKE